LQCAGTPIDICPQDSRITDGQSSGTKLFLQAPEKFSQMRAAVEGHDEDESGGEGVATTEKKQSSRRLQRRLVVEFLYMWDAHREADFRELLRLFFEENELRAEDNELACTYVENITARRDVVDGHIRQKTQNWSFERIAKVDLAILRLAVYELIFNRDVPAPVVINEAIEISKIYSSDESKRFVNGVLDKIAREIREN
jgi:N utilization substance protein B